MASNYRISFFFRPLKNQNVPYGLKKLNLALDCWLLLCCWQCTTNALDKQYINIYTVSQKNVHLFVLGDLDNFRYTASCENLTPDDFKFAHLTQPAAAVSGALCRSVCTKHQSGMWRSCSSGWLRYGLSSSRWGWMRRSNSGETD